MPRLPNKIYANDYAQEEVWEVLDAMTKGEFFDIRSVWYRTRTASYSQTCTVLRIAMEEGYIALCGIGMKNSKIYKRVV